MKKNLPCVSVLLSILLLSGSQLAFAETSKNKSSEKTPPKSWSGKMQALYRTLAELLTDTSSDRRFNDPANRGKIQAAADRLAKLSHGLKDKSVTAPDADPTLTLMADLLSSESKRAASAFRRGQRDYARSILQSVPSYCITCHTRSSAGPQFNQLAIEPAAKTLSSYERAEFFAATRQFDRADSELRKVIDAPKVSGAEIWNWKNAVLLDLAITVRVKKDPKRAGEIVEAVLAQPNAPTFMREDAKTWKKSVAEWAAEAPRAPATAEGYHAEAVRLLAKAREVQTYPMDRTADIVYLRASAAAHDLLGAAKEERLVSDGLLLAGLTYEVLSPLRTENLHESYYEMCVRRFPHTTSAEICYRRYEESVILGYTGSAGTDLPEDIEGKLKSLRELATVPTAKPTGTLQN